MSEMVERVAGAIYAANFPGFQPWEEALEDWKYWLASNPRAKADGSTNVGASLIAARAAITAMREPTRAMAEAGEGHPLADDVLGTWRAMIATALL